MKAYSVLGGVIVTTMASVYPLVGASSSHESFLDAEAILAGWESTYGSIRTMQVSYSNRLVEWRPLPDDPDKGLPVQIYYVERVEDGQRYHMRHTKTETGFDQPGLPAEHLLEQAFNGKATQAYSRRTRHGSIILGLTGKFQDMENQLKTYMFLLRRPAPHGLPALVRTLRRGLTEGNITVRPKLELVAGELCHVVEVAPRRDTAPEGMDRYVFWMAHDRGMCPMKYHMTHYDNSYRMEIEVKEIAVVEMDGVAVWYPKKACKSISDKNSGFSKHEITVTEFTPNVEVDESTFRFDFPPGTGVHDRVLGLSYVVAGVGPGGEVAPVRIVEPAEKEQPVKQTTDNPPAPWESIPEEEGEDSEPPTGKNDETEQGPNPVEPVDAKDRILGAKTISILGVLVLVAFGLLLWRRQSART